MDETVINGANLFWPKQFGLYPDDRENPNAGRDQWLLGLVASAPYVRVSAARLSLSTNSAPTALLCYSRVLAHGSDE